MKLIKKYLHLKCISVEKLNVWRHYVVKNVLIKNKELEIFSVCNKQKSFRVKITYINDNSKCLPYWEEIVS